MNSGKINFEKKGIVITENILLFKYKKQKITAEIGADSLVVTCYNEKIENLPIDNFSFQSGRFTDLE